MDLWDEEVWAVLRWAGLMLLAFTALVLLDFSELILLVFSGPVR